MAFNIDVNSTDYQETKRKYFELIEANKDWLHKGYFCTTEQIQMRIKDVLRNPQNNEDMVAGFKDGRLRLYKKVSPTAMMEILTIDDAFDAVLRAHVQCSHGDAATTYQVLSDQFSVVMFCVDALIDSCYFCAKSKLNALKTANEIARGVWRMNIFRDKDRLKVLAHSRASYLLILKEDATNFIILRALYPSLDETAFELMRLFAEFNYPKKIMVPSNLETYLHIMRIIHAIHPDSEMPVVLQSENKGIFEADKSEVLNELEDWATMENGCHWEQYCHMVQYKMNTKQKELTRLDPGQKANGVPFKLFFKYEPHSELKWIPKPNGD